MNPEGFHTPAFMNVEVINTGTELLLGAVTNTHLTYFAGRLFPLGLRVGRQVTVPDGTAIRDALAEAFPRAEVVLVTGGLGPTTDDLTRDFTAELLERPLAVDPKVLETIRSRFAARGSIMNERNARQAEVPRGATVLPNNHGTAPGLYLRSAPGTLGADHEVHLFLLPGPPRELFPMFEEMVEPILRRFLPPSGEVASRTYHLLGIGESQVEEAVGPGLLAIPGLELGYCARPGEVDLRCIGTPEALELAETIVMENVGSYLAARDSRKLEEYVVDLLTRRGETLATAESCTGGLLGNRITNVPGASGIYNAGFITYSNTAKSEAIGVPPGLIAAHGAVSTQVAAAMAEGALRHGKSDWALATTGIAGPDGGTPDKPQGTVYIALAGKDRTTVVEHHRFRRDRETFKNLATHAALHLLLRALDYRP